MTAHRFLDERMTSLEAAPGERDIAEELAETQRQISIAEFFEKNKQMLGFDSAARALITTVKEAVDNALDATEEAGFLPDIYVEIKEHNEYYTVIVEDNGPGITKDQIPKIFGKLLYGSRFHTRVQARGQQGIGISAAVMYAQLTSGKPAKITSRTPSGVDAEYFELVIDTENNEPEIQVAETTSWERPHGTRIEMHLEANMRARSQLKDYISHTAIVNPHARIELVEPDGSFKTDRVTDELPAETEAIRPHPHGVELGTLMKMLDATDSYSVSGFLQEEFTRVGSKTASDLLDAFRDRYFGREMGWLPGVDQDQGVFEAVVVSAVANKSADATSTFAEGVAEEVMGREGVSHHGLRQIVANVADSVETDFNTTFGATVRENTTSAVWEKITENRVDNLYRLLREAMSEQKSDRVVRGIAERLGSKFEETDRDRVTRSALRDFVNRAADMTVERDDATIGDTARETIDEVVWGEMETVPDEVPSVRSVAGDRDAAAALLEAMRSVEVMAPPTSCLAPIKAELIRDGLEKEVAADFYSSVTRTADVHGGDPFVVEAGIAFGGSLEDEGQIDLLRFANRVPLVYQQGACAITDVVRSIDWRNYSLDQSGGSGVPMGPAIVLVHVASTNVPFTSESKDAVANIPEIEHEIELAVRDVARDLKSHLNERRSLEKRREKQTVISDILPKMAEKVASVTEQDEPNVNGSLARIMNNVLVSREVMDGYVEVAVQNYSGSGVSLDVTEIVSSEPDEVSGGTAIDMDGEWFIQWSPEIPSGETVTLSYVVADDSTFDLDITGVPEEKLTIKQ